MKHYDLAVIGGVFAGVRHLLRQREAVPKDYSLKNRTLWAVRR